MGYRWRRMYYMTGLPGWMRFDYSPGWEGRSATGLPPTAEWLMSNGMMPQFRQYLSARRTPTTLPFYTPGGPVSREQEVQMLEQQAKAIEAQLEAGRRRLEEVRKSGLVKESQQTPYAPYGYPAPFYGTPTPYTAPSPEEELASLEEYRRELGEEVKGVEARIEDLKKLREREPET
jgi:hypothetical protein